VAGSGRLPATGGEALTALGGVLVAAALAIRRLQRRTGG
jgi:LPXTG-motif cell wall-anchored protein